MTELNVIERDVSENDDSKDFIHFEYQNGFGDAVRYLSSLISDSLDETYSIKVSGNHAKVTFIDFQLVCVKHETSSDWPNKSFRMSLPKDDYKSFQILEVFRAPSTVDTGLSESIKGSNPTTDSDSGGRSKPDFDDGDIYQDEDFENVGAGNVGGATKGNPEIYNNGAVEFLPEFDKNGADYLPTGQNNTGNHCQDCVHYIEGGGCHLVRGEIDPRAYCDLYADFGLFGMNKRGTAVLNLKMWGEEYRNKISESQISDFLNKIEREMRKRL